MYPAFITTAREQSLRGPHDNPLIGRKVIVVSEQVLNATPPHDLSLPSNCLSGGHILCTSGTTGNFKKLMWDSTREEARVSARSRAHGFDKNTMAYAWQFGQHTSPGWKVPLSIWHAGGCVVFDQRADWHQRIFEHAITVAFLSPSPFQKIVDTDNHKSNGCKILFTKRPGRIRKHCQSRCEVWRSSQQLLWFDRIEHTATRLAN